MDNMNNQPECEIDEHGNKYWSLNEYLHREDGPAIETPYGLKEWWLHGERHSKAGPAVETSYGLKNGGFTVKRCNPKMLLIIT